MYSLPEVFFVMTFYCISQCLQFPPGDLRAGAFESCQKLRPFLCPAHLFVNNAASFVNYKGQTNGLTP